MAIEIIDIKGNIEEYLNTVSGKTVIIGYGFTLDNIKDGDGEKSDKGRAIYMIVNGAGKEPSAGWRSIDAKTHFQCALNGMIDALDKTIDNREVVFISTTPLNPDKRDHCERVLFDELSRKTEEKGLTAAWGNYDTETAENKGAVSRYLRQKAQQMFDSMTDFYGCPIQLFEYEISENEDIAERLDGKSSDILVVSAPVSAGEKQFKAFSMMRVAVNNNIKVLLYEGGKHFDDKNEAALEGMIEAVKQIGHTKDAKYKICVASPYKLGFSSESSANRARCDDLYKEIKERGYEAYELRFNDTNENINSREKRSRSKNDRTAKREILQNYIARHTDNREFAGDDKRPNIKIYTYSR